MGRLKLMMQSKTDDCGVTCVRMILHYYGYSIKQSEIENNDIFNGSDGISSMLDIKRCVEYYGLIAKPYKIRNNCVFDELKEPIILYWDFNHFVVFEKKVKNFYYILDPAKGRVCLGESEFARHFSGMAMGFEKGDTFKRRRRIIKNEFQIIKESGIWNIRLSPKYLIGLMISQMLLFCIPFLIRNIVIACSYDKREALYTGVSILVLIVLYIITFFCTSQIRIKYINQIKKESNCKILQKIMNIPYEKIKKRQVGDILSRINNNNNICEIIATEIPQAAVAVVFAVLAIIYLFRINFLFTFILISVCILISSVYFFLMNKIIEYMRVEISNYANQNSVLTEGISSLYFIKANNIANKFLDKWMERYGFYIDSFAKKERIVSYLQSLQNVMGIVVQLLFLMASMLMAVIYSDRVDEAAIFLTMATLIYTPVMQVVYVIVEVIEEVPNIGRILELVGESEKERKKYKFALEDRITVKEMSFRYPKSTSEILSNVNVEFKKGETVAIVGESGAGKTTFINLLMGIEKTDMGEVLYDGHDINEISKNDNICCITQDNILYNGKLVEYLSLFVENYDDDKVAEGIEKLRLKKLFLNQWVNGLFEIDENGANLSGGQKQRLALLRMFLKEYDLLILDEPTSHLDEETARVIIDEISAMDSTKIIITHDVRLLDRADSIYKIANQKLVKLN